MPSPPTYGAIPPSAPHGVDGDDINRAPSAATALPAHQQTSSSRLLLARHIIGGRGDDRSPSSNMTLSTHLSAPVSRHYTDLILLFSYIITGLLDSSSVLIWGSFVSMQTGNTVYLGSGLVAAGKGTGTDDRWLRALISIAAFLAGSFFFSRYHRLFSAGTTRRWVLVSATGLQLLLILGAAVMVTLGPDGQTREQPISVWVAVPIVLVAFQSAGQAVASRVVKFPALTGVVLTSIYLDLAGDAKLFAGLRENAERNRRIAAPVLLLVGAVLGGLWAESEVGMMGALWTAVGLKVGVMLAWVFWAGEKDVGAGDAV